MRLAAPPVYILLNKPVGVVTTLLDPEGRPTVRDLLIGMRQRVFPVGRLDYHSAGLLLLTNDGALALRLTHPRYGIRKTYHVKVRGVPQAGQLAALVRGVPLPDGTTAPAEVRLVESSPKKAWISVTVAEGKNRQVRRMCDAVGLPVEKLERVAYGPLRLGKLPPGAWRYLEPEEVDRLHRHSGPEVASGGLPRRNRGRRRLEDPERDRLRERARERRGGPLVRERVSAGRDPAAAAAPRPLRGRSAEPRGDRPKSRASAVPRGGGQAAPAAVPRPPRGRPGAPRGGRPKSAPAAAPRGAGRAPHGAAPPRRPRPR